MITPDDVIVALSWSGEQPEMKNLVNYSARFAIPMIAVTSNAKSSLGAAARIVLELPKVREACPHNLAPTTSTLMQAAIGDALAIALLESRGFTALEFAKFHPGGKLGAMLKHTVRSHAHRRRGAVEAGRHQDVGRAGGDVGQGLWLRRHRRCATASMVGIITDGDLRRQMRPDLTELIVDDIMTRNPKVDRPRLARQRSAGAAQFGEDHDADRDGSRTSRSVSSTCMICCGRGWRSRLL